MTSLGPWAAPRKVRASSVPQYPNVAAALVGASRPEQVAENVKAAGVKLEPELMAKIDDVLGDIVEQDAGKTKETAPQKRRLTPRSAPGPYAVTTRHTGPVDVVPLAAGAVCSRA